MRHVPVLLTEVIEGLNLKPGMHVVDCTLGDGGHSEEIVKRVGKHGKVLGIDADPESLLRAKQYLYSYTEQMLFVRDNFVNLKEIVTSNHFAPVNGILMDLGWSSPQFEERGRGFSFEKDEPLDMRFTPESGVSAHTAADIINGYTRDELSLLFKQYGEEPLNREIAEAIALERKEYPITTTKQLVNIILAVYRKKLKSTKEVPWIGGIHPATKVFQSLRIETNHELDVLKKVLPQAVETLAPGGRVAVITFHSLEDRIVKHYFQTIEGVAGTIITKKPVIASDMEVKNNPRSRSAKLRVFEKK